MSSFKWAFVVIVFLNVSGFTWASEPDEIREKSEAMHWEAVKLAEHAQNEHAHHEHAASLKRQAKAMIVEAERLEQHRSQDELSGRLEHMRKAIEHLKHAGLQDVAEHVAQRVAAAEREMHEHQRPHDGDVIHEVMKQLEECRNEVKQLRDEVSDLKKDRK